MNIKFNIPLILTSFRIIVSIAFLPILLVSFLPENNGTTNFLLTFFFLIVAFTDFLDGYIARKYDQVTELGSILDPVADKFLLLSVLISLLTVNKIHYMWVLLLVGREFFVMALRLVALERGIKVRVSSAAKVKTALQMVSLSYIIFRHNTLSLLGWGVQWILLGGTVFLSCYSAWAYARLVAKKVLP